MKGLAGYFVLNQERKDILSLNQERKDILSLNEERKDVRIGRIGYKFKKYGDYR